MSSQEECDDQGPPVCENEQPCVDCVCRELGDCLLDGGIDVFDVLEKIDITLGRRTASAAQLVVCDDNCDDTIDLTDILNEIDVVLGRTPLPLRCP